VIQPSDTTFSHAIAGASNYMRWVTDEMRPYIGRRLLEVGLGHGAYRSHFGELEGYLGIDIDGDAVEAARAKSPEARFEQADIADLGFSARFTPDRFDTIVAINVLEHVPDDTAAFGQLMGALAPGGHLLLWIPAMPALYNDMDRLAGHVRRYTRHGLRGQLEALGEVRDLRYVNPIGGLGWWANGLVRKRSLNDPHVNMQIEWFDRIGVPISRTLGHATGRLFGQSLFAAVRKSPC